MAQDDEIEIKAKGAAQDAQEPTADGAPTEPVEDHQPENTTATSPVKSTEAEEVSLTVATSNARYVQRRLVGMRGYDVPPARQCATHHSSPELLLPPRTATSDDFITALFHALLT